MYSEPSGSQRIEDFLLRLLRRERQLHRRDQRRIQVVIPQLRR